MSAITYKESGVDIAKGAHFAESILGLMRRTFGERVVKNPGGFSGLFSLDYDKRLFRRSYRHPVLVASTDGVGTKLKVAFMTGRHDTVGIDVVAMCVNDILVQGAEPLFLLDYIGCGALEPEVLQQVVKGVAAGCQMADCALLGGETAEMPDMYRPGEYDLAGFVVGVAEKHKLVTGKKIRTGDVVIGLPSSGLHSNGYSLVRKVFFEQAGLGPGDSLPEFGIEGPLADELLKPTHIYVKAIREVMRHYRVKQILRGMAHITGGGLVENIPRVLPHGRAVRLYSDRWHRHPIFDAVQQMGQVPTDEMYRVFNMGIGFVVIVPPYFVESVVHKFAKAGQDAVVIGEVVPGDRTVTIL